jgi:hypothetical protein
VTNEIVLIELWPPFENVCVTFIVLTQFKTLTAFRKRHTSYLD